MLIYRYEMAGVPSKIREHAALPFVHAQGFPRRFAPDPSPALPLTCATTDRPRIIQALGRSFLYHHLKRDLLTGFDEEAYSDTAGMRMFGEKPFKIPHKRFLNNVSCTNQFLAQNTLNYRSSPANITP